MPSAEPGIREGITWEGVSVCRWPCLRHLVHLLPLYQRCGSGQLGRGGEKWRSTNKPLKTGGSKDSCPSAAPRYSMTSQLEHPEYSTVSSKAYF